VAPGRLGELIFFMMVPNIGFPQYRTCFLSPLWHQVLWDGSWILGKHVHPWNKHSYY